MHLNFPHGTTAAGDAAALDLAAAALDVAAVLVAVDVAVVAVDVAAVPFALSAPLSVSSDPLLLAAVCVLPVPPPAAAPRRPQDLARALEGAQQRGEHDRHRLSHSSNGGVEGIVTGFGVG